jgi:hypothetical protein
MQKHNKHYMLTYKLGEQITINEYCLKAEAASLC